MGTSLLTAVGAGAWVGGHALWEATEAHASTRSVEVRVVAEPEATLAPLAAPSGVEETRGFGIFLGVKDEYHLEPIRAGRITRVKVNKGGSSLSLRLDFDNGARAAFKPDQINLQTIPRKEVAAYRIDRLLGIGAVPPAIAGAYPVNDILSALDPEQAGLLPRLRAEIVVSPDGMATGELSWWIPEIVNARIEGVEMDSVEGLTLWRRYLTVGEAIPEEHKLLLAQVSNMVAFDYLVNNLDRWSGSNVKSSPDGRMIFFMDNTLAFGPDPDGHSKTQKYLFRVQKFSRSFRRSLRGLTEARLRQALSVDKGPYPELLTEDEIEGVLGRRDLLLQYIDDLCAAHGEEQVMVFP